ncbi:hypothetical protein [Gloeobacter kilaueensis]|uniref:Uncharacterized protein n=1 Tax=Gloeobacter kilaueensis (strain ATCC BAA-2537 / CCAP 1431/1 / ULC 316 / JS1) TaxID=1183438 RepID=U5QK60_GLOK1|nr:hypothetical protein [Gloeobacter kilaueensis]AGY58009.1 hypothetical protein GKIL_1763 [Gloeobacter kilaueensis JS1]
MLPPDANPEAKQTLSRRRFAVLALAAGAFGRAAPAAAEDLLSFGRDQPFFSFHSGFWLSLHHFLYQHGEYRKFLSNSTLPGTRAAAYRKALAEIDLLPLSHRRIWNSTVAEYQDHWAGKDLLFDDSLFGTKMVLIATPDSQPPQKIALPENLHTALTTAAPIYRKTWWPTHMRQSRLWVSKLMPGLKKYGPTIQKRLVSLYQQPRPTKGQVPIELVPYARRFNAYTTTEPTVIVLSTGPGDISGWAALETVFHEVSHGILSDEGPILTAFANLCKAKNAPVPEGFEHALIFYTTSEVVRQELARDGIAYSPFWNQDFYERVGWSNYDRVLKAFWQSYIDGRSAMEPVVAKMFEGLVS